MTEILSKRTPNRRLVVALLLVLGALPATAGRLRGTTTTSGGTPIPEVEIKLIPGNEDLPTVKIKSNKKGKFILGLLRPSDYRLVAFREGMRISRIDANLAEGEDESRWSFHDDLPPGAETPSFTVTGISEIDFDIQFQETSGAAGAFGTGEPVAPTAAIIEAVQQGQLAKALADIERNLESKPDSSTLHYLHGFALSVDGKFPEALKAAERCLELDPDFEGGNLLKAKVLEGSGQEEAAIAAFQRELEVAKSAEVKRDSYLGLAMLHEKHERDDEAIKVLQQLVVLMPDHVGAYKELASLYLKSGRQDEASVMLEKVSELGEQDPSILYNLGAQRFNDGNFEQAAKYFAQTLEADPGFADAYLRLAYARLNMNDREGAKESLRSYLERSSEETPDVQTARAILAQLEK